MTQKQNDGEIICPVCKTEQTIRTNKNGKLYVHCTIDGNIPLNTQAGQEWIRNNGKLYGAAAPKNAPPMAAKDESGKAGAKEQAPVAKPKTKRAPVQPPDEPATPPADKPTPKKSGGLGGIFGD